MIRLSFLLLAIGSLLFGDEGSIAPHEEHMLRFGGREIPQELESATELSGSLSKQGLRSPSHVVFGYHPYWNGTAWNNYNYQVLTHLAWFGLAMNASGGIDNAHGWPIHSLVDKAHANGVKVIVTVTLFDDASIATLLGSATYRQTAIDNLIARVSAGNADGVNIDFEFVKSASREHFNTFIHDLTQAFHDQIPGSEVSIAMPSVDWWGSYDYNYLSDNSDGLMIMAYGYYYSGSANAGPLSPLNEGRSSWHITRTIEDYLSKTGGDGSQLILGLPWYGIDFPVTSTDKGASVLADRNGSSVFYYNAEPQALSNDKQYDNTIQAAWYNYNNGEIHQVWYDDSLSLSTKYNYAKVKGIKGIGIWALGYDGGRPEIWGGLQDAFGADSPPIASPYFSVEYLGGDSALINCAPSSHTDQYEIHTSTDGVNYTLADSSGFPSFPIKDLPTGTVTFLKVRNRNTYGSSGFSETLALGIGSKSTRVLIVQGFDRSSGTVNNLDYIIQHGEAIHANGYSFSSTSNEAVESGKVNLSEYDIVDWISGEEATINESFSALEQAMVMDYLDGGGRFMVSGSEIGWDLERSGDINDQAFYRDYLKADYIVDDAASYTMQPSPQGIFNSLGPLTFDDGTHGTYDVDYPDGIKPVGGAASNLTFSGADYTTNGGAGIQYTGTFGSSYITSSLVYLSVGLETIYPEASRTAIMARVLDYFEQTVDRVPEIEIPETFRVSPAYPNPFNSAFRIEIQSPESMQVSLNIYNMKGQRVYHSQEELQAGNNNLSLQSFSNSAISSGLYLLQITGGTQHHVQRITYLK
ncbi:MAG: T9SS type A sorting domain-containing protein [Candidatus Marinimicrobia bacterium]|nr:T9SS type A sorting domain-containing protein [Candidatus Neomarinimicrobiota bacterium]MCF7850064.1 T9SS type A sorting domain-containing protein [Candidatus Neomarinimicrobiota bacterium]MCF7904724.1 T9SS type A sorting domain-containing protein [Candidatus Neomarinimicrobiota bacterium]